MATDTKAKSDSRVEMATGNAESSRDHHSHHQSVCQCHEKQPRQWTPTQFICPKNQRTMQMYTLSFLIDNNHSQVWTWVPKNLIKFKSLYFKTKYKISKEKIHVMRQFVQINRDHTCSHGWSNASKNKEKGDNELNNESLEDIRLDCLPAVSKSDFGHDLRHQKLKKQKQKWWPKLNDPCSWLMTSGVRSDH